MEEYIKYAEIYDSMLKKLIEKYYFKKSFMKDFRVVNIVRLDKDRWLIKLERGI